MLNLINGELYRLFRSKAYKYSIIGTIIVVILNVVIDGINFITFTDLNGVKYGFSMGLGDSAAYVGILRNIMSGSIFMYIIGVCFTTSITVNRWDSGALKNIVSYGYNRWEIFVANVLSIMIGVTSLIVMQFLGVLIISFFIVKPKEINIVLTLEVLAAYILIMGTMVSIYVTIGTLIPSQSVISVIVICEIMFFTMAGHLLKQSLVNFIPVLLLRDLATQCENLNLIGILITMGLLSSVVIDIGRIVFEKMEVR